MLRILLVEDDSYLGPALQALLQFGASATLVRDCSAALRSLEAEGFDVVLTDVDLGPGRDGLSLLEEVAERWPEVRRIAMSGVDRATDETFLMKPIGRDELEVILDRDDLAPRSSRPARISSTRVIRRVDDVDVVDLEAAHASREIQRANATSR